MNKFRNLTVIREHAKRSWLRLYATSWEVPGSSPGLGEIFLFYLIFPAAIWHRVRRGLFQEWVPGLVLGRKSGRHLRLTALPLSVGLMCNIVGASNSRNPKGLHVLHRDIFTFTLLSVIHCHYEIRRIRLGTYYVLWCICPMKELLSQGNLETRTQQ
jgi:hypothetical protein